ncbi:hypothetical protein [Helicobacter salomonis]|uniref:hypothetical protein n=1 Tax=Helicobacter salomonis TaxID=56878 RepID=UPI000CF11C8D|nr:hypothetical protein [Helicobacter salomonis]
MKPFVATALCGFLSFSAPLWAATSISTISEESTRFDNFFLNKFAQALFGHDATQKQARYEFLQSVLDPKLESAVLEQFKRNAQVFAPHAIAKAYLFTQPRIVALANGVKQAHFEVAVKAYSKENMEPLVHAREWVQVTFSYPETAHGHTALGDNLSNFKVLSFTHRPASKIHPVCGI